ncbi:MAG: LptA/OstA family protein, partial [Myxococcota bacterium]
MPDVATLLADRLATKGVDRIVGPASLGASATAEPSAETVRGWAERSHLWAVVVGRTTRLGRSLSVDVQVRGADDGLVLATFVEEIAGPADLGSAVERLSDQVLALHTPPGAPEEPAPPDEAAQASGSSGMTPFQGDAPIEISAAQLEAFEEDGRKRLVFTDGVRAAQGDFVLQSRRLEAFYPAHSSQPERLVASGNVVLEQLNRTAHCDVATYFRDDQRVVCAGDLAILTQDDDELSGKEITFHLDSQTL